MRSLIYQLSKFASVGVIATGVHALVYGVVGAVLEPMLANLIAFLIAFLFSYSGHFSGLFVIKRKGKKCIKLLLTSLGFW